MEVKSVDDLVSNHTLKELISMYESLYGIECCHRKKKDVAYAIWQYQQDTIRTADLSKNLIYLQNN